MASFYNMPRLLLRAFRAVAESPADSPAGPAGAFQDLLDAFRKEARATLAGARCSWERRWREEYEGACPLLQSCLLQESVRQAMPAWQAAPVSHFNHHLMGLGTTVDSLLAIRRLVFDERVLCPQDLAMILAADWEGHEALRQQIRARLPRFGQGSAEARALARELGRMWVAEVERAGRGMKRFRMWPGFYSHMVHVPEGACTPATPDGRRAGEPLSENMGPSFGTPRCSPTSILEDMAALPFDHTPSGAATLSLAAGDLEGDAGLERLVALLDGYFRMGGLHLQVNVLGAGDLEAAMREPGRHADLMVRVTGFSAYFTRLSRSVQEDLIRRQQRDGARRGWLMPVFAEEAPSNRRPELDNETPARA